MEIINEKLYTDLKELVKEVLPLIKPALTAGYWNRDIENYPNLTYDDQGFPKISTYPSKRSVSNAFSTSESDVHKINLSKFQKFVNLIGQLKAIQQFHDYYNYPENATRALEMNCQMWIQHMIERYFYLYEDEFNIEKYNNLYYPYEKYIYTKQLTFEIGVPLLFITFESENFELLPGIFIRRISDEANRARYRITKHSPKIVDSVYMSASHELVLSGYHYEKPANWHISPFSFENIYPHSLIQKFIISLNIVTGFTSGYSQLLIYPNDWVDYYWYDQLLLHGASSRNYPNYFDNFYWVDKDFPKVPKTSMSGIKSIFESLIKTKENKLEFATKRFYKSILREDEEDVIIDLIIALEMLLSDNEKSEITHKLALRVGTLLSKCGGETDPLQVFGNVKKIYAYRSKIVHGSHKTPVSKELKIDENNTIPIVDLATKYLREIIKIVCRDASFLNPVAIDNLMLTS